ncbi:MAG: M20/M25/M40 family metallo-hydrolase [Candidatus Methylomirabilia bacterium]
MKFFVRSLPAALLALSVGLAHAELPTLPSARWLWNQVKILSAPEMEGRASGTPGIERAARHIASVFREAGLTPGGRDGSFFQPFEVTTGIRLGFPTNLTLLTPDHRPLGLGQEFTPLAVSASGEAAGELVFVGYGITAPDLEYDDYAGLDVRGKIVLAMTREPRYHDPESPFRRPDAYHYSQRRHKIINAREHGAAAILLVPHPAAEHEALPVLRGISQPWGILAVAVAPAVGASLLAASGNRLPDLARAIDEALTPRSLPLGGVTLRLEVNLVRERGTARNVVGVLPGTDPGLEDELIVVGAHYDHLGLGGEGSLAPDQVGVIHPGADDNASGTAAMMALAKAFSAAGGLPRTLVFVAFAGEETGLLGSTHYSKHPPLPLKQTILMVNMDMVGRLQEGKLFVGGADSGTGLRQAIREAADGLGLHLKLRGDPFAPSDHVAFYLRQRPVLFLFTGAHADYHRPGDTWENVDADGLQRVAEFAARLLNGVGRHPSPPAYVKLDSPPSGTRRRGYGPFFGVIPDFSEGEWTGVRLAGVRSGSPAARAGVQPGDIIVKFAGVAINTLHDLVFALRSKRAGETVKVVILRQGHEKVVEATLEQRR